MWDAGYEIHYMAGIDIKLISLCKAIWPLFFLSKMAKKNVSSFVLKRWAESVVEWDWFDNHDSYIKVKRGGENQTIKSGKSENVKFRLCPSWSPPVSLSLSLSLCLSLHFPCSPHNPTF